MLVRHLELRTHRLDRLLPFYTQTLGLHLAEASHEGFSVQAGASRLSFHHQTEPAYYHFAFNIPYNRMSEAMDWLGQRVRLLTDNGQTCIDFPHWRAQSLYFLDPAGNILEFIGRRDRGSTDNPAFTSDLIENISEVGIAVQEVAASCASLRERAGVPVYSGSGPVFRALGDAQGLFIVVDCQNKTWFPTDRPARAFPLAATFLQHGQAFRLRSEQGEITELALA